MTRVQLQSLALLLVASTDLAAQGTAKSPDTIPAEFTSPALVKGFAPDASTLRVFREIGGSEMISARGVIVSFLREAHTHSPDVRPFVTPALFRRYASSRRLLEAMFEPEVSVQSVTLHGARRLGKDELEIEYLLVLIVEGSATINEGKARLKQSAGKWAISGFGPL